MSDFGSQHHPSDRQDTTGLPLALEQLEQTMRAAGQYVQPTKDLRPKALEAAASACRQQRANRWMSGLAFVVILLTATGLPTLVISAYPNPVVADSTELHRRAAHSVLKNPSEADWALFEVFTALRREHSEKFNRAD